MVTRARGSDPLLGLVKQAERGNLESAPGRSALSRAWLKGIRSCRSRGSGLTIGPGSSETKGVQPVTRTGRAF